MLVINSEMFELIDLELSELDEKIESLCSVLEEEIERFYIILLLRLELVKNKKIYISPVLMDGEEKLSLLDHAHYENNVVVVKFYDHRPFSRGVKTWRAQVMPKTKIMFLEPFCGSCSVNIFGNQRIVLQVRPPLPWLKSEQNDSHYGNHLAFNQIKNLLSLNKEYKKILDA